MDIDRDALIASFRVEADELLTEMESALLQLESGHDVRERLLRAAHTLKGIASCVSYDALTDFVHRYEDVLAKAQPETVSGLLRVIDAIRIAAGYEGVLPDDAEAALHAVELLAAEDVAAEPDARSESDARDARSETIRVATKKLDRMLDLAGELAISRARVAKVIADQTARVAPELVEAIADADRLDLEFQELVMSLRMVPVGREFQRFTRTVRDLAAAHGKLAQLFIEGGEVEIDNAVATALRDPLTHVLRNAIDHGIETPDEREEAGKPRSGSITVRARHNGGRIVIEIEDDGAGLDIPLITARAVEAGLIDAQSPIDERTASQLIFRHGFSTAEVASDLSGRGIGMDVVRRRVDSLRGTIEVESQAGRGTRFVITLPLTLAIIDGFALGVGDDTFIVPLDYVVECLDVPAGFDSDQDEGLINVRGEALPFLRLRHQLHMAASKPDRECIVVVTHNGGKAGICSDRLLGQIQTVIKPIGFLDRIPEVSSAAILGSGDVALVLDVPQLIHSAIEASSRRSPAA